MKKINLFSNTMGQTSSMNEKCPICTQKPENPVRVIVHTCNCEVFTPCFECWKECLKKRLTHEICRNCDEEISQDALYVEMSYTTF